MSERGKPQNTSGSGQAKSAVLNTAYAAKPGKNIKLAIKVQDISKVYTSGDIEVKALQHVSFELYQGEFAAIVGPSGSGKSTLMNLIGTIDKPTSGEIFIDGIEISKIKGKELASFRNKKLGFVFQAFNLINGLSAEMNAALPLMLSNVPTKEIEKRTKEMLEHLGLGARLKLKPMQMSGGEQQRVAIARALINNPTLVLADEPTGNLDTKSGDEVVKLLRRMCFENNVTIVMVTHNPDITKYCDTVIYIKDGRLEKQEMISKRFNV